VARAIQLGIEYNPAPPFASGHPDSADAATIEIARKRVAASHDRIAALV
jgi:cyclohexyl-isocyanide hydratase